MLDPRSYLGRGWSFPVRLGLDGGVRLSAYDEDIRLHNGVIGVDHVQWSDEDPHIGRTNALEPHSQIYDSRLMPPGGRRRHDQRTINEFIAIPVIRHRIKIGASEGTPVGQPLNSRLRRHVTHGRRPFVPRLKRNGHL